MQFNQGKCAIQIMQPSQADLSRLFLTLKLNKHASEHSLIQNLPFITFGLIN